MDVVIVGAGVGGLAAAWHLAERGIRTIVVEADRVASGASGRNGGFLIAGAAPMYNDARARFGDVIARRLYAATLAAQARVYAVAEEIGASDAFRRVGMLRLGVDADEARHVRAHAAALAADGFPGELVDEHALPAPLRGDGRIGLETPHDASVHPVRWLHALAAALERRGVRVFEGAPARLVPDGVATRSATIRAAATVIAADGAVGSLIPALRGRVRARRLHMIATAPLAIEHVRRPVYARYGHEYHQQLADGTVVLGGFSDLDGEASYTADPTPNPLVVARLSRYLAEDLCIDAPVARAWVGIVGYSDDDRPYAGADPDDGRRYLMGGYSGTGNLCSWVAARVVADLIASGASVDADLFDPAR